MPGDESYDEHEAVRARLAAEPAPRMPDDVAARLHATLEREVRQRPASASADDTEPASATVTPLRRRGRWKAPLLAAAGVVAVIAIGIPVVNQSSDTGDGDGAMSSDAGGTSLEGQDAAPPSTGAGRNGDDSGTTTAPGAEPTAVPALSRSDFAHDVRTLLVRPELLPARSEASIRTAVRCAGDVPTGTQGQSVTLDGDPALVLTSRSRGVVPGTEVRAVVCSSHGPTVAARTTLPD